MKAPVINRLRQHRLALVVGIGVALYLKFLLLPTAVLFYKLHHATVIDFIYWGYSGFKFAGYYFGIWEYQTLTCVVVGLLLFILLGWRGRARLEGRI